MLEYMLAPFVACMLLVAIHSYLGLHVIAREVIFVDLALAQMAALGAVAALLVGVGPDSNAAYAFAFGFVALGAALLALTRTRGPSRVPHEAIIGIVYVVATAAALLLADRAPQGAEAIREILAGSIVWVTWPTIVKRLALPYVVLGVFHYVLRHRFLTISFDPAEAGRQGWRVRWWDFLFYLSFGVVIIFSVPIGGVLVVFTFLVVPAVIAFLFTRDLRQLAVVAWASGAIASLAGLWLSYRFDLPTGPMIVCTYGGLLAIAAAGRRFVRTAA